MLPALALLALPLAASAQQASAPSVLSLLPVEDPPLRMGEERSGTLGPRDFRTTSGATVRAFELEGRRGAPISIDLVSDSFDAYLFLLGPAGSEMATDDDSGGACHARLSRFLPSDGVYHVVVGALSGGTGDFVLRVGERQGPTAPGDCLGAGADEGTAVMRRLDPRGTLEPGSEASGTLSSADPTIPDGTPVQVWLLRAPPGRAAVVDLVSDAFDAFLYVLPPTGAAWTDDDSGGACHSRIEVTPEGEEPYRIVVNTLSGTGPYTLKVSERPPPAAPGPCVPSHAGATG